MAAILMSRGTMAKMKEGQDLCKQEQGITTLLFTRKTDRRAGLIVDKSSSRQDIKTKSVIFDGQPTRVLLPRNMVQVRGYSFDMFLDDRAVNANDLNPEG